MQFISNIVYAVATAQLCKVFIQEKIFNHFQVTCDKYLLLEQNSTGFMRIIFNF